MCSIFTQSVSHVLSPLDLCLGTESSEVQLLWLQNLSDMGVEVLPSTDEQEETIRSARSIFEFDARTIDGELVSLEKYR